MTNVSEIVNAPVLWRDFLYGEIIKRHVEEYNPSIIDELKSIRDILCQGYYYKDNIFLTVVSLALDGFDFRLQNRKQVLEGEALTIYYENLHFFNYLNKKNIEFYSRLLDISRKYNLIAPELLYPFDMANIINQYNEKFIPPRISLFNKDINHNFGILEVQNNLTFETKGNVTLDDNALEYLNIQRITKKIRNNEQLTQEELKEYNIYLKNSELGKFRKDSVEKYLFGLLAWDTAKSGSDNSLANKEYIKNRTINKKCNEYVCDNINNTDCPRQEACSKFMQEVRQSVSNSIKEKQLLGSKINRPKVNPTVDPKIIRYKLEFFGL